MKALIQIIFFILILFTPIPVLAGALQDEIVRIAPTYNGITEPWGQNKGPEVNRILANVGLEPGNPWCMALVYTINKEACENLKIKNVLPATGGSANYWIYASKHKITFKVTPAKQIILGTKMNKGGTGIFKRGPFRTDGTFPGHANVIIYQIDNKSYYGFDGNTGGGSEWNGEGAAFKIRKLGVPSLLFIGAIDVR